MSESILFHIFVTFRCLLGYSLFQDGHFILKFPRHFEFVILNMLISFNLIKSLILS